MGLSQDAGKTLHRTKRGWMWNQFFLLEEYTGPDTQYVGKVSFVLKRCLRDDEHDNCFFPALHSPPDLIFFFFIFEGMLFSNHH